MVENGDLQSLALMFNLTQQFVQKLTQEQPMAGIFHVIHRAAILSVWTKCSASVLHARPKALRCFKVLSHLSGMYEPTETGNKPGTRSASFRFLLQRPWPQFTQQRFCFGIWRHQLPSRYVEVLWHDTDSFVTLCCINLNNWNLCKKSKTEKQPPCYRSLYSIQKIVWCFHPLVSARLGWNKKTVI